MKIPTIYEMCLELSSFHLQQMLFNCHVSIRALNLIGNIKFQLYDIRRKSQLEVTFMIPLKKLKGNPTFFAVSAT